MTRFLVQFDMVSYVILLGMRPLESTLLTVYHRNLTKMQNCNHHRCLTNGILLSNRVCKQNSPQD